MVCSGNVGGPIAISGCYDAVSVVPALGGLFNFRCSSHVLPNDSVVSSDTTLIVFGSRSFVARGNGCGSGASRFALFGNRGLSSTSRCIATVHGIMGGGFGIDTRVLSAGCCDCIVGQRRLCSGWGWRPRLQILVLFGAMFY